MSQFQLELKAQTYLYFSPSNQRKKIRNGVVVMDDPLVPLIEIRSSDMSPEAFFYAWRESVEAFFDSLPEDESSYQGDIRVCVLGEVMLFETAFSAQHFKRDRKRILTFDNDLIVFQIYTQGSCQIKNGNTEFIARPNAAILLDMGLSLQSEAEDSHAYSLVIPRTLLAKYLPNINQLTGCLTAPDDPKVTILRQALEAVFDQLPNIPMSDGTVIGSSLVNLMASLLMTGIKAQELSAPGEQAILDSVCDYIEHNLSLPDLGVAPLLKAFPLSRSSLYRLFKPLGGVDNYIRERRLQRCYDELKSPEHLHRKVIDIATLWGFSNQSSFSRIFKQRYGLKPSEVRDIAVQRAQGGLILSIDKEIADDESPAQIRWWAHHLGG